jgi:acyl-homoserine-lactone acylase
MIALGLGLAVREGLPQQDQSGTTSASPCGEHAVVRRDHYGVPHILAASEEAAAYAHGSVTAEDHGALLAKAFLRARGKLASQFGPNFVKDDFLVRSLRIYETAAERFHELPPLLQAVVNAYAAGYSDYLKQHREQFPEWAEPVTGVEVLAHARASLLVDFALDLRPWQMAARDRAGSNMWAIGPALSASRKSMLLANPHLGWNAEVPLHEVHIKVPGVINISGAAFVGSPVVSIGFNGSLGWSHTVNWLDADDVYELTLDSTGTKYLYNGRYLPLVERPIVIEVRTGDGVKPEHRKALWSHHGPVMQVKGDKAWAYKSANVDLVNFLTQYNRMAKAASIQDFRAALNMQQLPMFNVAYADKAGNIWYLFNGRVPIRPGGYDWRGVVPGNSDKTEWFAMWPLDSLPQLLNPKSGYLQNCNDAPWYPNREQLIDRTPFRDYLQQDGVTWRSMLSLRILSGEKNLTLEKLMQHKYDSTFLIAERLKSDLLRALKQEDGKWNSAIAVLESWDNTLQAESRGAVLFHAWWNEYSKMTARVFQTPFDHIDPVRTPTGLGDQEKAVEAFAKTVAEIEKQYGSIDVAWGAIHRARRGSLDLPASGSSYTLEGTSYQQASDGKFVIQAGDTYTLAVEFGDSPRAYSVLPYSQASNPKSPYFNNQLELYVQHKFKPTWFSEEEVTANLSRQYCPAQPVSK